MIKQQPEHRSVGKALPHESAAGHVSGQATYIDDIPLPSDTLHVATGFAQVARGRITAIDLSKVRAAPGIVDVITAADIPGDPDIGPVYPGDPLLAADEVAYVGQPVFAVVAESLRQAQQAARLATIDIESQAAITRVKSALAEETYVLPSRHWHYESDDATGNSAYRIANELYIRGQEHFYLEGQAAVAMPEEDNQLRIYSSTQHPDEVQHLAAKVIDVPMHKVRVICRRMGGGFGGKESQAALPACLAAVFAHRLRRAVKYRMPRHDDMIQTGKRHDVLASYAFSCQRDGLLNSAEIMLAGKCGYSPDLSEGIVDRAMFHATNAYYVPKVKITGHRCYTNTVSNTAFRGFGGPQGMLVAEAAMDELAHAAGLDALELRKRNLYAPGRDVTPYWQQVEQHHLLDLITSLETDSDYRARQSAAETFNAAHSQFKKGLALTPVQFGISFTVTHLNQAGALVNIFKDGSIEINHAGTEMGQGLYTKIQQVAAEALGVSVERVLPCATQTDKVPNGSPTAASSGSDLNGMAVLNACEKLKSRLVDFLRDEHSWPKEEPVVFAEGRLHCGDKLTMLFDEAIKLAYFARVSLSATGFYKTPEIHFDKVAGKGKPFYYFACGAAASEVIIDTLTGEYRVLRVDILHDAGNSLNPAVDLGQIEGGFIQGMGWLTTEELLWDDDGVLMSNSPANYKIPAAADCPPEFNVAFYQHENPKPTIYRSKATGEPPLMLAISVWCALRNACSAVSDYEVLPPLAVPATPEAVFWAVQAAQGAK